MLKFVRDLMHTGDAVPLKPLGTKMSDARGGDDGQGLRLRRHRRCATAMLAGIITDGDLRRHMRPDLMDAHGRRGDDEEPEDHRPRLARQRGAGDPQRRRRSRR